MEKKKKKESDNNFNIRSQHFLKPIKGAHQFQLLTKIRGSNHKMKHLQFNIYVNTQIASIGFTIRTNLKWSAYRYVHIQIE